MPRRPWSLLRATAPAAADPPTDAALLARFAGDRDDAAFEVLLRRHAPVVFGVCRRVLRDHHAAEDAFQATFLILARRAGSVHGPSLPGWLHRVARRVAVRAARRRPTERLTFDPPSTAPSNDGTELLDAEIDRLPDRFRLPLVLCYLEGRTTDEAAKLLGIPRGTVLSRLHAARAKLADRLTRRGLAVPVIGTVAVGHVLIETTFRGAAGGVANPAAVALSVEVLHMGVRKKIAAAAAVLVATAGLGTGLGVVAVGQPAADGGALAAQAPPADIKPAPINDPARAMKEIDTAEAALRDTIDLLTNKQQHLLRAGGGEVNYRALSALLERLEVQILASEDVVAQRDLAVDSALRFLAEDIKKPTDKAISDNMPYPAEASQLYNQIEGLLLTVDRQNDPELKQPGNRKILDQIAELRGKIDAIKANQRQKYIDDHIDRIKKQKQAFHRDAAQSLVAAKESHKRLQAKRAELINRMSEARGSEAALQQYEDRIQVCREIARSLHRQRILLDLESRGVKIPTSPAPDPRIDELLRTVASLKMEIAELKAAKK